MAVQRGTRKMRDRRNDDVEAPADARYDHDDDDARYDDEEYDDDERKPYPQPKPRKPPRITSLI
jgi:hypothetical protein